MPVEAEDDDGACSLQSRSPFDDQPNKLASCPVVAAADSQNLPVPVICLYHPVLSSPPRLQLSLRHFFSAPQPAPHHGSARSHSYQSP